MPKKRIKRVESLWFTKYSECNAEISAINKEKDLIVPIITMIMKKDVDGLHAEYQKHLDHKYPLNKLSSDEWIDSFVHSWTELQNRLAYQNKILQHLNGISDKDNYKGNDYPKNGDKPC